MSVQSVPQYSASDLSLQVFTNAQQRQFVTNLLNDIVTLRNAVDALVTIVNANRALYNAHTHQCDGSEAATYYCFGPVTNAASEVAPSAGTASVQAVGVAPSTVKVTV